ncbi:MAG: hypothetical protein R3E87_22805 [Burkholderiaceae bacterium]
MISTTRTCWGLPRRGALSLAVALQCAAPAVLAEDRPEAGEVELQVAWTGGAERNATEFAIDAGILPGLHLELEYGRARPADDPDESRTSGWGMTVEALRPLTAGWTGGLRVLVESEKDRGTRLSERETGFDAVVLFAHPQTATEWELDLGARRDDSGSRPVWAVQVAREIGHGVLLGVDYSGGRHERPAVAARVEFELDDELKLQFIAGRGGNGRTATIALEVALPLW